MTLGFPRTLVTGASSGIGRALAIVSARPGAVLHLCARDAERLEDTARRCRDAGAVVDARLIDVRDAAAMRDWILGTGGLDLVVANAGIAAPDILAGPETPALTDAIFATNVGGMLNTVQPALALMRRQDKGADGRRGRIAALASTAGFVPMPTAPAYCASKSAVDAWVTGSARAASLEGIGLTSICPGYVRTPMTALNRFPMPGLMEPEDAARRILRAARAGNVRATFPWWMGIAARLGANLPAGSIAHLVDGRSRYASVDTSTDAMETAE